ncbi:PREDICTED: uncharacterized protein LOC109215751 [Nicotiana attenuata]|uniref:uncharacterized protein LOC109215751 n=1 Tax=Nicotiana attenuata TaxID=49451 RepID=UPI0009049D28|nr:PREDICTED: uncharacterized protein LOC109215751 [Nicotiana attenuata]
MTLAMKRDQANDQNYYNGGNVDENMIILRKRIQEMKMIEKNYEPPTEWMDWEKNIYVNYNSSICEAMGLLQYLLMNTRPSLALGMVVLIALSVPTSTFFVLFHLVEFTKGVLAALLLSPFPPEADPGFEDDGGTINGELYQ